MDEKKLELMKKLMALAERGVGGEKETAQRKLEQLMKKYKIDEADLSEEKTEDFDFRYKNEFEKRLLRQLFYKIVPDYRSKAYIYRYGKGSKSTYGINCTKAEGLQIGIEYDFYRELWKEEQDFFFSCFIQKHKIFSMRKEDIEGIDSETPIEELLRMRKLMDGMQDGTMETLIESKEE